MRGGREREQNFVFVMVKIVSWLCVLVIAKGRQKAETYILYMALVSGSLWNVCVIRKT